LLRFFWLLSRGVWTELATRSDIAVGVVPGYIWYVFDLLNYQVNLGTD
jgi:hypothetical protein